MIHPFRINKTIIIDPYNWESNTLADPIYVISLVLSSRKYTYRIDDNLISFEKEKSLTRRSNNWANGWVSVESENNQLLIKLTLENNFFLIFFFILAVILICFEIFNYSGLRGLLAPFILLGIYYFISIIQVAEEAQTIKRQIQMKFQK